MLKKIIVCKGKFGFADRLRLLTACIHYAKKFNRALYIDWRDKPQSFEFSSFFDLNLDLCDPNPENLLQETHSNVYPSLWTGNMHKYYDWAPGFKNSIELDKNYEESVMVFDEAWHPWFPELIASHLVLKKILSDPLSHYLNSWGDYIGYHIRLSDQVKAENGSNDYLALQKYDQTLNQEIESLNIFLEKSSQNIFLSTDNSIIKLKFKDHPKILMQGEELFKLFDYQQKNKLMGIHNINGHGIDSNSLNLESLLDFFLLVFSKEVVTSRGNFSKTADTLRGTPEILKIISG